MNIWSELNFARFALCALFSLLLLCNTARGVAVEDIHAKEPSPISPTIQDNGMLHLVLHYLSMKLIREMETEEETTLNKRQRQLMHDGILGFYDEILKHPALNTARIAFSQKKPDFDQFRPGYTEDTAVTDGRLKKRRSSGPLTEICTSISGWQEISRAVNSNHVPVNLFPDQHFYTTTCQSSGQSCRHIDMSYTTSALCTSRSSWTTAYVEDGPDNYSWEWIKVDTCCSCAASS